MSLSFIGAQAFGVIAIILFIVSFQIKSNRLLYIAQSGGCLAYCLQYLLLGAYTGCLSEVSFIVRNMILTRYNQWAWVRWRGWAVVFSLICVVITYFTWDGPISLLAMVAGIGGAFGLWSNNARIIRLSNLFVISPAWLVYNIICGAYFGCINELIIIGSVLVSIKRYGWREMGDPDSDFQKK